MKTLTEEGQQAVVDLAGKYGLTLQSVETLMHAVIKGNGTMAQFDIAELGGSGQWMKGGMTMVGDMFNNGLKTKVDQICSDLGTLYTSGKIAETSTRPMDDDYSVQPGKDWPSIFGNPTSSGAQNNFKYAYFGPARRLVIDEDGKRYIYDTRHYRISGVSQQQGSGRSYQFTSPEGLVHLSDLLLISEPTEQLQRQQEIPQQEVQDDVRNAYRSPGEQAARSPEEIIIDTIQKLHMLLEKGQITEEEFKTKKEELLGKI